MDYATPDRRRSKKDLRKKRQFRAYKRGGKFRSSTVEEGKKKE